MTSDSSVHDSTVGILAASTRIVKGLPRRIALALVLSLTVVPMSVPTVRAGGGPMNVLVLYNAADPDAAGVARYYADARSIPDAQLCGVAGVDPLALSITFEDYAAIVQPRFRECLGAVPQADEIDYLVTVRGLPYRVDIAGGYTASLEAMLQVDGGVDSDGLEIAGQAQRTTSGYYQASVKNPAFVDGRAEDGDFTVSNPYSGSYQSAPAVVRDSKQPRSFRASDDWLDRTLDLTGHLTVVTRLDGFDYDDARDLVDRGSSADGTFPDAELLCMAGADDARGARDPECEFTARMLAAAGLNGYWLSPHDAALSGHTVATYFTGAASLTTGIAGQTYVPGAITDNLTSYGAVPENFVCSADGLTCPAAESQTSIARYIRAGATGAHGTVNEPLNNVFPLASAHLFYTFGYNLGESQLFALRYLYWQNLFLGDPLTTPYAERPLVSLSSAGAPAGEPVEVTASHPNGIAEIRVYVDGVWVGGDLSDTASVVIPGFAGEVHDVVAVAIAMDAPVTRIGWPEPNQQPRPEVQGWTRVEFDVLPPPDTGDPFRDSAGGEPEPGCGCSNGTGAGTSPLALWAIATLASAALTRRHRRDPAERA
ncbi:MAG: TIGR03790 family protein [Myxococcales bacterium]|nr:TIGR03790 family protein [Myxococcales bacterium]